MRVAVLWTTLSGYLNACLRELASRPGVELLVAHSAPESEAPYDISLFAWMENEVVWRDQRDAELLAARLDAFNPEVVVVCGWHEPIYRRIMPQLKGRCLRLMTMDNCWEGTLKQRIGALVSPLYVHPMTDAAWVPGIRQTIFARHLKFPVRSILHGSLSCEHAEFAAIYQQRIDSDSPLPRAFIFVGRLVAAKGLNTLASAYEHYRSVTADPWPLIVCGTGPLVSELRNRAGIEMRGFVQPSDLPGEMRRAGCLILPSVFEPWALAINEATAAGLIVIATENTGAVPHLVQNFHNGFLMTAGDVSGLSALMGTVSSLSEEKKESMSRASQALSQQYTPKRWADSLLGFAAGYKVGQRP